MLSVKVASEVFDEHRQAAKQIVDLAEIENRELTSVESRDFDRHVAAAKSSRRELELAKLQQENILSTAGRREEKMTNQAVLPHNGKLPNEQPRQQVHHRIGKLKCFSDPRDAFDAGMVMRAIVAHEYHRPDSVAHEYCQSRLGWSVSNAATEGSGPSGGYLVPAPLSNAIIDVREQVGVMRNILRLMPMTSDTLTIPKKAGGLTVYYPGETQAITPSDPGWSQVGFVAKKRAVAHQISQELQDDSLIAIADDAVREMAYALALNEDREMINGTGISTDGGVVGIKSAIGAGGVSTAAAGHDTWAELDLADMTACMAKLPDRFHAGMPVWLCSSAFYFNVMLRIHAAAGGNTIASLMAGQSSRNFLGYPVYTSQFLPTTTAADTVAAYFGSFQMGAILAERVGVRVARSDDYAFLNDLTTLKATTRYDFKIHEPGDGSDPGAYVALKTAAGG